VVLVVLLTALSHIIIKWQVSAAGSFPDSFADRLAYLTQLSLSPWIILAMAAIFASFLAWAVALTNLELSRAYPLTSATFVLVVLAGALLFNEALTTTKLIGLALIIAGIIVGSQG